MTHRSASSAMRASRRQQCASLRTSLRIGDPKRPGLGKRGVLVSLVLEGNHQEKRLRNETHIRIEGLTKK